MDTKKFYACEFHTNWCANHQLPNYPVYPYKHRESWRFNGHFCIKTMKIKISQVRSAQDFFYVVFSFTVYAKQSTSGTFTSPFWVHCKCNIVKVCNPDLSAPNAYSLSYFIRTLDNVSTRRLLVLHTRTLRKQFIQLFPIPLCKTFVM